MNLLSLKYVIEVDKAKSISKAAQNLFMGQPNLSKAIKELEHELGITIFKRTTKGVAPTREGAEFITHANTILSQVDELESMYKAPEEKNIRFSITAARADYISFGFTDFLSRMKRGAPLSVTFKEANAMAAIRDVAEGTSNLGIIRCPTLFESEFLSFLDEHQLKREVIWEYSMGVLMSRHHPLAPLSEIPYGALANYTEIAYGNIETPAPSYTKTIIETPVKPSSKCIYLYEQGTLYRLLQEVAGAYFWSPPVTKQFLEKKELVLRYCAISSLGSKDLVIYPKDYQLNMWEKMFVQSVKSATRNCVLV